MARHLRSSQGDVVQGHLVDRPVEPGPGTALPDRQRLRIVDHRLVRHRSRHIRAVDIQMHRRPVLGRNQVMPLRRIRHRHRRDSNIRVSRAPQHQLIGRINQQHPITNLLRRDHLARRRPHRATLHPRLNRKTVADVQRRTRRNLHPASRTVESDSGIRIAHDRTRLAQRRPRLIHAVIRPRAIARNRPRRLPQPPIRNETGRGQDRAAVGRGTGCAACVRGHGRRLQRAGRARSGGVARRHSGANRRANIG